MTPVVKFLARINNEKILSANANSQRGMDALFVNPLRRGECVYVPHIGKLKGTHFSTARMYPWGVWLWRNIWRREQSTAEIVWEYSLQSTKTSYLSSDSLPVISRADLSGYASMHQQLPILIPMQVAFVATIAHQHKISQSTPWMYIYECRGHVRQCTARGAHVLEDFPTTYECINAQITHAQVDDISHVFTCPSATTHVRAEGVDTCEIHLSVDDLVNLRISKRATALFCADTSSEIARYEYRRLRFRRIEAITWMVAVFLLSVSFVNISGFVSYLFLANSEVPKMARQYSARARNPVPFSTYFQTFKNNPPQKRFTHEF